MKYRLTDSAKRGLKHVASLAQADVEADQAEETPRFHGGELNDIYAALRWVSCLEVEHSASKPEGGEG